jgi:DNA-binding MarR family transcriptional regulator
MAEQAGQSRKAQDADAVLRACRLLVAISVRSIAAVEEQVNVTELRILTVATSRGPITLSGLATSVGIHVSRASRTCDRLVERGLLARDEDPLDRRSVRLTVTNAGSRILRTVAASRRTALAPALRRLSPAQRAELAEALEALTAAAGEPSESELWSMGWAT